MSRCKSCRARIVWAETSGGKRIPVEPHPDYTAADPDQGNIRLLERRDVPPLATVGAPKSGAWISHFATCPDAKRFRRQRR